MYPRLPEVRLALAVVTQALGEAHEGAKLACRVCDETSRSWREAAKHEHAKGHRVASVDPNPRGVAALLWLYDAESIAWIEAAGLDVDTLHDQIARLRDLTVARFEASPSLRRACRKQRVNYARTEARYANQKRKEDARVRSDSRRPRD